MNIFSGNKEISDFMSPMISEIKSAASESKAPTQTRGSPEGKASREPNNRKIIEETELYERREETLEAFTRMVYEEGYTVGERGQIAYAYKVCRAHSENGQKLSQELKKLGIKGIIHEELKSKYNDVTTTFTAGASTLAGYLLIIRLKEMPLKQ